MLHGIVDGQVYHSLSCHACCHLILKCVTSSIMYVCSSWLLIWDWQSMTSFPWDIPVNIYVALPEV